MNSLESTSQKTVVSAFAQSIARSFQIIPKNMIFRQINPIFIYQWDGQTIDNKITGKGTFRTKDNLTNQIIFWCTASRWRDNFPIGQIQIGRVIIYPSKQSNIKIKQTHIYNGSIKNLKKHGKGLYQIQTIYQNGQHKKLSFQGQWENDIFLRGIQQDSQGCRQVQLNKNIQWSNFKTKQIVKFNQLTGKNLEKQKNNNELKMLDLNKRNNNKKQSKNQTISLEIPSQFYLK